MWEVEGRGELTLAALVELMRREGFELTVGKPRLPTHTPSGCARSSWTGPPARSARGRSLAAPELPARRNVAGRAGRRPSAASDDGIGGG